MLNSDWTNIFNKSFVFTAIAFFLSLIYALRFIFSQRLLEAIIFVSFWVIIVLVISLGVGMCAESTPITRLHNGTIERKVLLSGLLLFLGIFIGPIMTMPFVIAFLLFFEMFLDMNVTPALFYNLFQLLLIAGIFSVIVGSVIGAFVGALWQWAKLY